MMLTDSDDPTIRQPLHRLTVPERALLRLLLSRDIPGRYELLAQAETVKTTGRSCPCGCPTFSLVADPDLPPAPVAEYMVSDAHGTDPEGNLVGALLFVKDGYLHELEIYSVTGVDIAGLPTAAALKLNERSEPTDRDSRHPLNP
jgi:hypothetical protein